MYIHIHIKTCFQTIHIDTEFAQPDTNGCILYSSIILCTKIAKGRMYVPTQFAGHCSMYITCVRQQCLELIKFICELTFGAQ